MIGTLRSIQADLAAEQAPSDDAPIGEHWTYLWHQCLAAMLTVRFWLLVVTVAAIAAVVT